MFNFAGTRKPDFKNIKKISYDSYWHGRGFNMRSKLMAREKVCMDWIKDGSSVVDIGCGNSRMIYELKKNKGCKTYAVDVSPLVIESLGKEGISGQAVDISKSNFEFLNDKEYDYIILNEILEHVDNPEEIVDRLKSKAKHLIISIPNTGYYRYRFNLMFRGRVPTQWFKHPSEHLRFWTHKDFLNWLDDLNFELISCQTTDGFHLFKNSWKNMFGHLISYLVKIKD